MDERPSEMSWDQALSDTRPGETRGGEVPAYPTAATAAGVAPAPEAGPAPERPEQIRAQIGQTRAEMSETINAIQDRLNPQTLKEQAQEQVEELADQAKEKLKETVQETVQTAKDAAYDATIGKVGNVMRDVGDSIGQVARQPAVQSAVRTVKSNPLPLALIGLGLGMLYMGRRRDRADVYGRRDAYVDRYGTDLGYEAAWGDRSDREPGVVERAQTAVGDFVGSAQQTVSNAASRTAESVSNVASRTAESVSNVAGQARDQAANLGSQIQYGARRVQHQYERSLRENPLAVGALALATGAAVGLMLPSTRVEDEWMGETRENFTQAAEGVARSTIEKVQQVAGEAGRAVRREAENQGLTG